VIAAALALGACAAGCSKSSTPGTGPEPTYALSGQILLIGTRSDDSGTPLGELMVDDADGARVYLVRDGVVVDSAASADGGFTFQVPLGTYRAHARIGATADSTEELHVHDRARTFSESIRLAPPELTPWPNPFAASLAVRFSVATAGPARVTVVGADGIALRTLLDSNLGAGVHQVAWDGTNAAGQPVPPGPYWIVLEAGATGAAGLAIRAAVGLSGSVAIESRLADEVNADLGTRVQLDADGLRIHLEGPDGRDSTLTHDGQFQFAVAGSGLYRVWARLAPGGPAFEHSATLGTRDTVLPPLAIAAFGQMDNYPNPFAHPHGVGFEFHQAAADPVEVEVRTLAGDRVWWQSTDGVIGLNHVHWNGVDMAQQPVANGSYVMVARAGGTVRHNVVFKEAGSGARLRASRRR
jgi:hypothetical protein